MAFAEGKVQELRNNLKLMDGALLTEKSQHIKTSKALLREQSKRIMVEIRSSRRIKKLQQDLSEAQNKIKNIRSNSKRDELNLQKKSNDGPPCICKKRKAEDGRVKSYKDLSPDLKKAVQQKVENFVSGGETSLKLRRESIGIFLADTVRSGRKYDVQQKVQVVLNDEKTANALITKIRHMKKKFQKGHRARAKSFILRKKEQIGEKK